MGDSFIDSLDNEVEGRKWEYEEGDTLVGTVLSVIDGDGDYGPYKGYMVAPEAEFTTEDGGSSEAVSADDPLIFYVNENSAARRSIPGSGINVGDRLGVKFVGEREAKSGRMFKKFNVKVESALTAN
jgi:hypothetical protein